MKWIKFQFARLAVCWADSFKSRPVLRAEIALHQQYVGLVIDVLTGHCADYGRDRKEGETPWVSERRVYRTERDSKVAG